ncbi:HEAT repeat protein [Planctomycetes bacterium Pla163]|uniref:HEAT repeat protein n=1 Tax=Rohdeia mirabilis TaxID=2528008 RepID=A0A518CWL4_9BACT|nr:HEAT repeat protein [Planctomycetes bacterium Pla163]
MTAINSSSSLLAACALLFAAVPLAHAHPVPFVGAEPVAAASPTHALIARANDVEALAARIAAEGDDVTPQVFYDLAVIGTLEALAVLEGALDTIGDETRREYLFDACAIFAKQATSETAKSFLVRQAKGGARAIDRLGATRALCAFDHAAREDLLELIASSDDVEVRHAAADGLAPYLLRGRSIEHIDLALDLALARQSPQTARHYVGIAREDRDAAATLSHRDVLALCTARMTAGAGMTHALERLATGKVTPAWKRVLVDALGDRPEPVVVKTLVRLLRDLDPALVLSCLDHLLAHRERGAWDTFDEDLLPLLASKDEAVRRAAVVAIGVFGASDPNWRAEVLEMSRAKDRPTRQGAARALGELRSPDAIARLFELFQEDKDWTVRYEALKALENLRLPESLPLLVGRIEKETLRMREEISFSLRMLTGLSINPTRWKAWLDAEGAAFTMPTFEEAVAAEDQRKRNRDDGSAGTSTGFFNIRLVSDRVIFICDMSSSMEEPAKEQPGTGGSVASTGRDGMTRFALAKLQLLAVLREIPDDTLFNVYFFSHVLEPFDKQMKRMKRTTRGKAIKWVNGQFPNGSTNVYDAILAAYLEPSVDTIYLLTDGFPTDGAITDPHEIRERVRHWNATRHVVVHTISLGRYSELLEGLAADSGGTYREFL